MKKTLPLILAILMLVCALPTGADICSPTGADIDSLTGADIDSVSGGLFAGMPSPMHEYLSMKDLNEDYPSLEMAEPPVDAENILYLVIDGGDDYPIGEIRFTLNGIEYSYRSCAFAEGDSPFNSDANLAGLYYQFDFEDTDVIPTGSQFITMHVCHNEAENIGYAEWYDADAGCGYSVSASTSVSELVVMASELIESSSSSATIQGVIGVISDTSLMMRLENGNIVSLPLSIETYAKPGDFVEVQYVGNLMSNPLVLNISVLYASASFSGTVVAHDQNSVTVESASGTTIKFLFSVDTQVTGAAKEIKNNAQVSVTYSGDLTSSVYAYEICIDVPGSELDPSLIDKNLTGTVTKLSNSQMTIKNSKGKKYSFKLVSTTKYIGKYKLEVGCTVNVTYDGYASKTPDAKIVKTTKEAPDPTPTPTPAKKLKKAEGTVTNVMGIWITLDDGHTYTVNGATCKITGADFAVVGAHAEFRYYKSGSERIVEKATFDFLDY